MATPEKNKIEHYLLLVKESLDEDKAEDIVVINLVGKASFADYMVIATGLADRQIIAMAAHLEEKLKEAGLKQIKIEGANGSSWVLIDAGNIIVHLFKPECRLLYNLEKMWGQDWDTTQSEKAVELFKQYQNES
ncbi:ribosome silencing factor [Entomobacter blattae]|uniref:Ribosomal silencing factor RsfS n=1 Tax=Entomobacter blattae TaxID=2762277 RepID=A0A7H1NQ99_9PROT|nr:ribosome silencing factor [Entomobacter blattae]QNT77959.1 Ribosomal silencing factor RsfS [Entomobacter blattae]